MTYFLIRNWCYKVLVLSSILVVDVNSCDLSWEFVEQLIDGVCPSLSSVKVKDVLGKYTMDVGGLVTPELLSECLSCGRDLTKTARLRGNELVKSGINTAPYAPAIRHFFETKLPPDMKKAAEKSQELLTTTKLLQMKICSSTDITPNTFMAFLENQVIKIKDAEFCKPFTVVCQKYKYRSIDGTCNNLDHPGWGRAGAAFTRIADPRYGDGIYSMPNALSGNPLPNPRALSSKLFTNKPVFSKILNYLNMQWGQLIAHDMVHIMMAAPDDGGGFQCCIGEGKEVLPSAMLHDKCIPICIPEDDPFYRHHGIKCLNVIRGYTAPRDDCTLGPAEQMNVVTSYLDGSTIYGSNPKLAAKLRSLKDGKLKEKKDKNSRAYLPEVEDKCAACDLRNSSDPCYLTGDGRTNQTPMLALFHTILVREHNRVAEILAKLNPHWNDEKLYQETRRIIVAEIQHITYQEWLPLNFGDAYYRYHRISPSTLYTHDYDDQVNPGIINSFGAAAFRFMHSSIPDTFMMCPASYKYAHLYRLSDHYANPYLLETSPNSIDDLVRGSLLHSSGEFDPCFSGEITNLLFKSCNDWGLDLIAMDIQRGRDHGVASYNDFREICGLRRAKTFQDLAGEIPQDRIVALSKFYECVDDIDLFVGGAMEQDVHGSVLGQTLQCIVAEQFYRVRIGDRFFYDNGEMPHSFTPEQLKELKKASMARLILDNTDIHCIQRNAFQLESQVNPKLTKEQIPFVDFTAWKSSNKLDIFD